jgi:hypothetical protein
MEPYIIGAGWLLFAFLHLRYQAIDKLVNLVSQVSRRSLTTSQSVHQSELDLTTDKLECGQNALLSRQNTFERSEVECQVSSSTRRQ